MKKLLLIPLLFIAFLASAQKVERQEVEQMQKEIENLTMRMAQADSVPKSVSVGAKSFMVKYENGFALIFLDRLGGLDATQDLRRSEFTKEGDFSEYIVTILFDEKLNRYRLAENVTEYKMEESEQVIKVKFTEIEEFRRSVIQ